MNIYLPINNDVEDLVNVLQVLKPGLLTSRQVMEVSTEDKTLSLLLKKVAEGVEDEFNARRIMSSPRAKKGRKSSKPSLVMDVEVRPSFAAEEEEK